MLVWLPAYYGAVAIPTAMAPRAWHAHEMIFGFLPAIVTGFLLTAIPNWTGRLPLQGKPLTLLVLVWAAGWVAVFTSSWTSLPFAALVEVSFLALVAAAATREVVAGRNWRNLRVVAVVCLLLSIAALEAGKAAPAGALKAISRDRPAPSAPIARPGDDRQVTASWSLANRDSERNRSPRPINPARAR